MIRDGFPASSARKEGMSMVGTGFGFGCWQISWRVSWGEGQRLLFLKTFLPMQIWLCSFRTSQYQRYIAITFWPCWNPFLPSILLYKEDQLRRLASLITDGVDDLLFCFQWTDACTFLWKPPTGEKTKERATIQSWHYLNQQNMEALMLI